MSLAQARGILPSLIARGRDVSCEQSAHEALIETATGLSPRVEDAAPVLLTQFGDIESGAAKVARNTARFDADAPTLRKPPWIRVRLPAGNAVGELKTRLRDSALVTVVAHQELGDKILACIGISPSYPERERRAAVVTGAALP